MICQWVPSRSPVSFAAYGTSLTHLDVDVNMKKLATALASAALILGGTVATTAPAEAASGPFRFTRIQFDTPGADLPVSNTKLNGEYVTIKNISSTKRSLAGYKVKDKTGHTYAFGKPALNPGQSLRLYTGKGIATNGTLVKRYWGSSYYIWNNTGDTAYLTKDGVRKDSCAFTSAGYYTNC